MIPANADPRARRGPRVMLLLALAMLCVGLLWPLSAQAAIVTFKGEWGTGLGWTMKFTKKNGTLKLKRYATEDNPPFEQLYEATCDGGETARWSPPTGILAPAVKVKDGKFVAKGEGENFGAGTNTTKLTGEIKGQVIEGTFSWKNFDNGNQAGCNGRASYTATR